MFGIIEGQTKMSRMMLQILFARGRFLMRDDEAAEWRGG